MERSRPPPFCPNPSLRTVRRVDFVCWSVGVPTSDDPLGLRIPCCKFAYHPFVGRAQRKRKVPFVLFPSRWPHAPFARPYDGGVESHGDRYSPSACFGVGGRARAPLATSLSVARRRRNGAADALSRRRFRPRVARRAAQDFIDRGCGSQASAWPGLCTVALNRAGAGTPVMELRRSAIAVVASAAKRGGVAIGGHGGARVRREPRLRTSAGAREATAPQGAGASAGAGLSA